ncbi:MAG: lysine-2,3-aminomutase-like protein [Beijerinckiaceae bacterium]
MTAHDAKPEKTKPQGPYLRSIGALSGAGLIGASDPAELENVARRYAVSISPALAELIDPDDPDDPIRLQFVPDARELMTLPQELADPIGDEAHSPVPGIVHRYPDRVLLKALKVCPVYCRFCFRRESVGPGEGQILDGAEVDAACAYIASNPAIWEVILTGGDPLALSPRRIEALMARLAAIPHVRTIRIHTRVPVAEPARVDAAMIAAIKSCGKAVFVALHANHPRELFADARAACARIVEAGIPMVSQSVLLRGVNDDPEVLAALMRAFVECRIKPYYLHHPDLAPGTSHFRLPLEEGKAIFGKLRGRLSGLAQPQYVIDIPGGYGKSPVAAAIRDGNTGPTFRVADWRGVTHTYEDTPAARLENGSPAKKT